MTINRADRTNRKWKCTFLTALAFKHRQIQLAEPFGVAEDVYLGDLSTAHREGHDREQLSLRAWRPALAAPLTSAESLITPRAEKLSAPRATCSAPRISVELPACAPASVRRTTSGSSTATSRWKSPSRAAATKAATTPR